MSKHIKKAFLADPFAWVVGLTLVLAAVFALNVYTHHEKPQAQEPVDAVPVSE